MDEEVPSSFTRSSVFEKDSQPPFQSKNFSASNPDSNVKIKNKRKSKQRRLFIKRKTNEHRDVPKTEEITISINPWKAGKVLLVILVVLTVFFAGRMSTISTTEELSVLSGLFDSMSADEQTVSPSGAAVDSSGIKVAPVNSDSASDSKSDSNSETDLQASKTVGESKNTKEDTTDNTVNDTAKTDTTDSSTEDTDTNTGSSSSKIITDYKNVALSLDDTFIKWMETWGKITGISYTIKNNEAGIIKPDHFVMLVEGYDDLEKKFNVAESSKSIDAAETEKADVAVSGGFAYNEATAGDLSGVSIDLYLYDSSDKLITHVSKITDLSGE